MTRTEALYNFFSQFDIPAYPTNAVPDDAKFPWLTYEPTLSFYDDDPVGISVDLWYRTESESVPNAKVDEIASAIGYGGCLISFDEGAIWIKRGSPFCNSLIDGSDNTIKRRALNVTLEYISV